MLVDPKECERLAQMAAEQRGELKRYERGRLDLLLQAEGVEVIDVNIELFRLSGALRKIAARVRTESGAGPTDAKV